jgi:hypothetical protein
MAWAEEGMWPLHDVPRDAWQKRYGVAITDAQIDVLRGAAVRVGSSSAWVSKGGLVMTNHHVAYSCIRDLSTPANNLLANGFYAETEAAEIRCPGWDARLLVSYENITAQFGGLTGARLIAAEREAEGKCRQSTGLACELVTLYRGAERWMYRYQRWTDVRLAFAPEEQAGFFGGDTDNFNYPRYALDVAFLRVYENDQPVRPQHWLRQAQEGVKAGDTVFSIGNPRSTERGRTVADVRALRDFTYPITLSGAEGQREALVEYGKTNDEATRQARAARFGVENGLKATRGAFKLLNEPRFFARKQAVEDDLRKRATEAVLRDARVSALMAPPGDPWSRIEAIVSARSRRAMEYAAQQPGNRGVLEAALSIVALAYEAELPASERLKEFSGARATRTAARLAADQPHYAGLEVARQHDRLQESMDLVGQEHPWVAQLLNGQSASAAATALVNASQLGRTSVREGLVKGGKKAVDASKDAAIVTARALYPRWRKQALWNELEIEQKLAAEYDRIGQIRFLLEGKSFAPDATGTLRISVGQTQGYDRDGLTTAWMTTMGGKFERAKAFDNKGEFEAPPSWWGARGKFDADTPYNWVSTLDTVGGSSGSPIVNARGEWVGIVFDGNMDGLGTRFAYDSRRGRSVAVDARAIVTALDSIYNAHRIVRELRGE